ncbi:MAG: hypothetical protein L0J81_07680, partial [Lactiplantibacillus plantarum]|nr:hypothetical protein [Lactiplantibacillus plantarum]
ALRHSSLRAFIATSRELGVALLLLPSGMTTVSTFIYQSFEQGEAAAGMGPSGIDGSIGIHWTDCS